MEFVEKLREVTRKNASSLATQSMDGIHRTLTNSLVESMTKREEQLTEKFLIDLLKILKKQNLSFIKCFGEKVYDLKLAGTATKDSDKD